MLVTVILGFSFLPRPCAVAMATPVRPSKHSDLTARSAQPEVPREAGFSRDSKCTLAPESRFDCGRDRLLSQTECEERGCCFSPLPNSAGPPWCYYPSLYPGYKMGPLTPTSRGQAATLTRDKPSYLPRDVSTLRLVVEESAGCLRLTVSTEPWLGGNKLE